MVRVRVGVRVMVRARVRARVRVGVALLVVDSELLGKERGTCAREM